MCLVFFFATASGEGLRGMNQSTVLSGGGIGVHRYGNRHRVLFCLGWQAGNGEVNHGDSNSSLRNGAYHSVRLHQDAARYHSLHENTRDVAQSAAALDNCSARALEHCSTMPSKRYERSRTVIAASAMKGPILQPPSVSASNDAGYFSCLDYEPKLFARDYAGSRNSSSFTLLRMGCDIQTVWEMTTGPIPSNFPARDVRQEWPNT
jgi:hypothetical protein